MFGRSAARGRCVGAEKYCGSGEGHYSTQGGDPLRRPCRGGCRDPTTLRAPVFRYRRYLAAIPPGAGDPINALEKLQRPASVSGFREQLKTSHGPERLFWRFAPCIEYQAAKANAIVSSSVPIPRGDMCQSKSHGHREGHAHHPGSRPFQPRSSVRGVAIPDSQPTRRQVLRRLATGGLASVASGLPLGSLVRAFADDDEPASRGQAQATLFDFKKVADGIYGAIARPTAMLNCNAAVIVNRDHVPRRQHALETLGRESPDQADSAGDYAGPRPVCGQQPPSR